MKKFIMLAALVATIGAGTAPVLAADADGGTDAAAQPPAGKGTPEQQGRRDQMCKDNPERCAQMKARAEERRKQCEADPEKCKAEAKARREQMCKDNPERCAQMKARAEERRKQCAANPADCPPRKAAPAPAAQ